MNPLSSRLLKEESFFTGGSYNSNKLFTTVPTSVYTLNCGKAVRFDLLSRYDVPCVLGPSLSIKMGY